jgi:hypothetical protein
LISLRWPQSWCGRKFAWCWTAKLFQLKSKSFSFTLLSAWLSMWI